MAEEPRDAAQKQAMIAALRILAREKGSIPRLRAQLSGELGAVAADKTLGELESRGVLAVKSSSVRVSAFLQGKGNAVIREELARRLLSAAEIASAIAAIPSEVDRATNVARKKWPVVCGRDEHERAGKLVRFLMGRGFEPDACREAARTVAGL